MTTATLPEIPNPVARPALLLQPVASHAVRAVDMSFAGLPYRLFLAFPRRRGAGACRLLYLLDGNAAFAELTPETLAARPDLAVAGIGYPTDRMFDFEGRSRDYTPMPMTGWDGGPRQALRRAHGGAADFLGRLVGPMRAWIEAELGRPVGERLLWGHSYGGLFGLFVLARAPAAFDTYHIASPSLWWDGGALSGDLSGPLPHVHLYGGTLERSSRPLPQMALADLATRLGTAHHSLSADHRQMLALSLAAAVTAT